MFILKWIFNFYKAIFKLIIKIINKKKIDNMLVKSYENRERVYNDLTSTEYRELTIYNKLNEYKKLCTNSKIKNFPKVDKLWSIYNQVILEESAKKNYMFCSAAFNSQYEILLNEKKYDEALECYLNSLYCAYFVNKDYVSTIKIKKVKELYSKNNDIELHKLIDICVSNRIPNLYNKKYIDELYKKINS